MHIQRLSPKTDRLCPGQAQMIQPVSLTPEGGYFLPTAQQLVSLRQQAGQIKNIMVFRELRIAAVDTLDQFHFTDLYKTFMEKNKNIQLYLQTEHSMEIHQLIENQLTDLGFVFSLHKSPNVVAVPLYTEKNVILYHQTSRFQQTRDWNDLKPADEIYLTFGNDHDIWHRHRFPDHDMRKISIGTFSMLPSLFDLPDTWAILPQSLANIMIKRNPELSCEMIADDPPPARTAYLLRYKYSKPWVQELGRLFLDEVLAMIRSDPALELLYPASRRGEPPK